MSCQIKNNKGEQRISIRSMGEKRHLQKKTGSTESNDVLLAHEIFIHLIEKTRRKAL